MSTNFLWNIVKLGPAVLGASFLISSNSLAAQTPASEVLPQQMAENAADQTLVQETTRQPDRAPQTPVEVASSNFKVTPNPVAASSPVEQTQVAQAAPAEPTESGLEEINPYSSPNTPEDNGMDQVNNVSQLRDVRPTDWAYQALRDLVERYNCIAGYPDGTFRGTRAMTRYEFAAGLNSCLRQIEKLIAGGGGDGATRADLDKLNQLVAQFGPELATLRGRVDRLEGRVGFLEAHQFSTTTKLNAEVIIAASDVFGEKLAVNSVDAAGNRLPGSNTELDVNTILSNRVRLNLDTSFTGKDRLRTRLQARNTTPFSGNITGTSMTRLSFDGTEENDVLLSRLDYRFPLGPRTTVNIAATGGEYNEYVETFTGQIASSGDGSISRFGRFNPIYRQSAEGSGITLNHNISNRLGLAVGYMVPRNSVAGTSIQGNVASNPAEGFGLFEGGYSALAQLTFKPTDALNVGLTYIRSYQNQESGIAVSSGTGSTFANQPFGTTATSSNHYGLEANFRISPRFNVGGWAGYTTAIAESGKNLPLVNTGDSATIFNYAVTLAFPDLGKKGNLLGFVFGMPPKVTSNDFGAGKQRQDRDTSYHLEGFYRYRLTNNVDITPGVFVILNPNHNDNNDTQYVGVLRTTFKF